MLEKYGDSEYVVFWKDEKLVMRSPGSPELKDYDGRFGSLTHLSQDQSAVFPVVKGH